MWFAPPSVDAVIPPAYTLAVIVFGFPLLVLLGMVLPVTAVVSLARSHRELQALGALRLKRTVEVILVSQIGGGTLAVVFARYWPWRRRTASVQSVLTLIIWMLGLLTPLAYAAAVWSCDVLSISPD